MDRILNAYTQELRVHRDHPGAGELQMGANFNLAGLTIRHKPNNLGFRQRSTVTRF